MTTFALERRPADRLISTSASFLIHAAFFLAGGALYVHGVEYGIESGSGMELSLVAALPAAVQEEPEPSEDTDMVQPAAAHEATVLMEAPRPQPVSGDGSSPVPGLDKTTFHSSAGAVTQAKPRYLRNPAPAYPEEARRLGQEGLVTLSADVDVSGRASQVWLKKSSGYALLDDSALKTVRRWKFEPARIGPLATSSQVEIPVRFQLKEGR